MDTNQAQRITDKLNKRAVRRNKKALASKPKPVAHKEIPPRNIWKTMCLAGLGLLVMTMVISAAKPSKPQYQYGENVRNESHYGYPELPDRNLERKLRDIEFFRNR